MDGKRAQKDAAAGRWQFDRPEVSRPSPATAAAGALLRSGVAAVGFDLGETLLTYAGLPLDWTTHYGRALKEAAVGAGLVLGDDDPRLAAAGEILLRYNTRRNPRTLEVDATTIFAEVGGLWGLSAAQQAAVLAGFFGYFQQQMVAYPEAAEVLRNLRAAGLRVGVLTDVPYGMPRAFVERDLRVSGLQPHLDKWLTSVDVGHRKPAPEGFRALAEALGATPAQCVYVGNEPKDIAGARGAGMMAVLVVREGPAPQLGQDATIENLAALSVWLGL